MTTPTIHPDLGPADEGPQAVKQFRFLFGMREKDEKYVVERKENGVWSKYPYTETITWQGSFYDTKVVLLSQEMPYATGPKDDTFSVWIVTAHHEDTFEWERDEEGNTLGRYLYYDAYRAGIFTRGDLRKLWGR